jgi:hypothetical protein
MLKWKNIKEALIFVPAVHLFLCFAYLFFYELGFAGGIHNFASPTDAFSISLNALAPTYISILIFLPIIVFNDKIGDRLFKSNFKNTIDVQRWYFVVLIVLALTLFSSAVIIFLVWSVYRIILLVREYGFFPFAAITIIVGGISFSVFAIVSRRISKARIMRVAMLAFFMTVISLVMSGLSDAQRDRYVEFNWIKKHTASCGNFAVIRPLSDNFLAVAPDESRIVINEACKLMFTLHRRDEFQRLPDVGIYRPWKYD